MGRPAVTWALRFPTLAMFVMVLLFCYIPFMSANSLSETNVPAFDDFNKRDIFMGLKMQCQTHPRNCPGGYILKRGRYPENYMNKEPTASLEVDEFEPAQTEMTTGDDFRKSLRKLRYQLLEVLRPYSLASSDESRDDW